MILIETSVLVSVVRDRTGMAERRVIDLAGDRLLVLSAFSELELLYGARDEVQWVLLQRALSTRRILQPSQTTWQNAARINFDLRRKGTTVRSVIDCCIAQMAIENEALLLHTDRDFDHIASIHPLSHSRFDLS